MTTYFLDSSALVKYYVTEPGTNWVRRIVDAEENACFVASISLAEVAAALAQLQRDGPFDKTFVRITLSRFKEELRLRLFMDHPVDAATIELAAELAVRHPLKGYDAVQVASAILAQQITGTVFVFVSGGRQMLRAASAEGLATEDPEDHTDEDRQR